VTKDTGNSTSSAVHVSALGLRSAPCADLDGYVYLTAEAAAHGDWDTGTESWDLDDYADMAELGREWLESNA